MNKIRIGFILWALMACVCCVDSPPRNHGNGDRLLRRNSSGHPISTNEEEIPKGPPLIPSNNFHTPSLTENRSFSENSTIKEVPPEGTFIPSNDFHTPSSTQNRLFSESTTDKEVTPEGTFIPSNDFHTPSSTQNRSLPEITTDKEVTPEGTLIPSNDFHPPSSTSEKQYFPDNTTGKNTTGKNTTGKNTTGKNTTGKNTTGKNTTGKNTTGKNTTGKNTTVENQTIQNKTVDHSGGEINSSHPFPINYLCTICNWLSSTDNGRIVSMVLVCVILVGIYLLIENIMNAHLALRNRRGIIFRP